MCVMPQQRWLSGAREMVICMRFLSVSFELMTVAAVNNNASLQGLAYCLFSLHKRHDNPTRSLTLQRPKSRRFSSTTGCCGRLCTNLCGWTGTVQVAIQARLHSPTVITASTYDAIIVNDRICYARRVLPCCSPLAAAQH